MTLTCANAHLSGSMRTSVDKPRRSSNPTATASPAPGRASDPAPHFTPASYSLARQAFAKETLGADSLSRPAPVGSSSVSAASRRLLIAGTLFLALMVIGGLVSIAAGWPAQLGGGADPNNVAGEAVTRGTAFSPPLLPLLVFVVALAVSVRPGVVGVVATVLLILISAAFIIGGLGEAFAAPTPDVPRAVLVLSGLVAVLFGLGVMVAAAARLRAGRQQRRLP